MWGATHTILERYFSLAYSTTLHVLTTSTAKKQGTHPAHLAMRKAIPLPPSRDPPNTSSHTPQRPPMRIRCRLPVAPAAHLSCAGSICPETMMTHLQDPPLQPWQRNEATRTKRRQRSPRNYPPMVSVTSAPRRPSPLAQMTTWTPLGVKGRKRNPRHPRSHADATSILSRSPNMHLRRTCCLLVPRSRCLRNTLQHLHMPKGLWTNSSRKSLM